MEKNPYYQSFEYARDSVKQLLTLSTTIIGVSIAFQKDVFHPAAMIPKIFVTTTWLSFMISVFFGVLALFSITANVEAIERALIAGVNPSDIIGLSADNILSRVKVQAVTFVLGILLAIISCLTLMLCL